MTLTKEQTEYLEGKRAELWELQKTGSLFDYFKKSANLEDELRAKYDEIIPEFVKEITGLIKVLEVMDSSRVLENSGDSLGDMVQNFAELLSIPYDQQLIEGLSRIAKGGRE